MRNEFSFKWNGAFSGKWPLNHEKGDLLFENEVCFEHTIIFINNAPHLWKRNFSSRIEFVFTKIPPISEIEPIWSINEPLPKHDKIALMLVIAKAVWKIQPALDLSFLHFMRRPIQGTPSKTPPCLFIFHVKKACLWERFISCFSWYLVPL